MSRHRRGSGGGPSGSVKEEAIEVEGEVIQALGAGRYRVRVDGSDHLLICKTGGKMGKFRIRITNRSKIAIQNTTLRRGTSNIGR